MLKYTQLKIEIPWILDVQVHTCSDICWFVVDCLHFLFWELFCDFNKFQSILSFDKFYMILVNVDKSW